MKIHLPADAQVRAHLNAAFYEVESIRCSLVNSGEIVVAPAHRMAWTKFSC